MRLHTSLCAMVFIFLLSIASKPGQVEAGENERDYTQLLQDVFQTELVYPQEAGEVQFTLSPTFREGDDRDIIEIPLGIELGITDFWQVSLEWQSHVNRNSREGSTTQGIGDLELGTQYSFMNIADELFHAALGLEVGVPVGDIDKELSEGFLEISPSLILAQDLPRFHDSQIFTQIGFSFVDRLKNHADPDEDEPEAHDFIWNAGFFIPCGDVRWVTEFNWRTNEWNHNGDENELYITPGVIWVLPEGWEAGLGVPVGLNDKSDNYRVIASLTYEFDLFYNDRE